MAKQVTITYEDGRVETFDVKPKHLIAAERIMDKDITKHGVEATFITAWKACKSPLKFDDWLETVETVNQSVVEDEEADPTSAPSPEGSPT